MNVQSLMNLLNHYGVAFLSFSVALLSITNNNKKETSSHATRVCVRIALYKFLKTRTALSEFTTADIIVRFIVVIGI